MIGNRVGPEVWILLPVLSLLAACHSGGRTTTNSFTIDSIGDTLILGEQVAGQWASPHSLQLDLMISGPGGEGEPPFGQIGHIVVEPSGGIIVEDVLGISVARFGADGVFRDFLGRRGDGPGEYRYPYGIAVLKDGRIAVRDQQLPGINLYNSDGTFLEKWPLFDLIRGSYGLEVNHDGLLMVSAPFSRTTPYTPRDYGFVILSPEGIVVDSIPPPTTPWDGEVLVGDFHPQKHIAWYSSEFVVVGVSNGYHFDIHRPNQTIRIEQPYEPVPVSAAEKGAFEIGMAWRRRRGSLFLENIPPPPDHKAAYRRILVTRTGQIWVFRHGPGEQWSTLDHGGGLILPLFREPLRIDVFDLEGRLLGVVEGDANIDPRVVSNDTVWAVVKGEFDEDYVARYLVR